MNLIKFYEAPPRTSVYRWYDEFNQGRSSLQDEFREGLPKSVIVPETIGCIDAPTDIARSSCDLSGD